MTARQKLENLTHSWYGFVAFGALMSLFERGLGFFSIARGVVGLLVAFAGVWFLGNRLLAKSDIWRALLLLSSAFLTLTGGLQVMRMSWHLVHDVSIGGLVEIAIVFIGLSMNYRSFRTLRDPSVKAYFA